MAGNERSKEAVRIILCGKTLEVRKNVTSLLQPGMEVIHSINSLDDAKDNLGDLLAGRGPKTSSPPDHIGSHDYSQPPCAAVIGRAFALDDVEVLNSLYRGSGSEPVAWITGNPDVVPPSKPEQEYAEAGAENVQKAFEKWREAGAESEEIVLY